MERAKSFFNFATSKGGRIIVLLFLAVIAVIAYGCNAARNSNNGAELVSPVVGALSADTIACPDVNGQGYSTKFGDLGYWCTNNGANVNDVVQHPEKAGTWTLFSADAPYNEWRVYR